MTTAIRRVAVIGAGTMGAGIAQAAAQAGWATALTDADPATLPRALAAIASTLEGTVSRGKLTAQAAEAIRGRLEAAETLELACGEADLVIEAVVEDATVKGEVLARAAAAARPGALVASNTSSLSITELARHLPRPERFCGLHFFNPVHIMKLVEIVVHPGLSPATRDEALAVVQAMDKQPIVVQDSPGFASSRLGIVLGLEAIRMLEQGVASAADIDTAMELGYRHPMGPLRLTDLVGLDVRLKIADYLHDTLGGAQYQAPALLRRMVADGKLGQKSGQGFYPWTGP